MYHSIYNLIMSAIFSGVTITGWIELVVTTLATACCVFAFIIPFLIVWKVIRLVCGG